MPEEVIRFKIRFEEYTDAGWGKCNGCGCLMGKEGLRRLIIEAVEPAKGSKTIVAEYLICHYCINRLALQCLTELNVAIKTIEMKIEKLKEMSEK